MKKAEAHKQADLYRKTKAEFDLAYILGIIHFRSKEGFYNIRVHHSLIMEEVILKIGDLGYGIVRKTHTNPCFSEGSLEPYYTISW